jgi:exosome complex component CSL4
MSAEELPKLVVPGDLLGTAEEYVPGRGTYEYNGQVYAALLGHPRVDGQAKTVTVEALHAIPHLAEGEAVYARVDEIKAAMLVVTVLRSATTDRIVPGFPEGTIHISKAKDSYVEDLSREFAVGDLVKAEVLQGYPVVKLSTQGPAYGVVAARCSDCHSPMTSREGGLLCPRCGRKEHRKVSEDFGAIHVARPAAMALGETSPGA